MAQRSLGICAGILIAARLSMFYADWHTPIWVSQKALYVAFLCVLEVFVRRPVRKRKGPQIAVLQEFRLVIFQATALAVVSRLPAEIIRCSPKADTLMLPQ